jgi:hypothetical protein
MPYADGRFRLKSRVSIHIDDLHLKASITISGSTPDSPAWYEVDRRSDLVAELAAYTTPSDLLDLGATLHRYDDADTEEIRAILDAQALRTRRRSAERLAAGFDRAECVTKFGMISS